MSADRRELGWRLRCFVCMSTISRLHAAQPCSASHRWILERGPGDEAPNRQPPCLTRRAGRPVPESPPSARCVAYSAPETTAHPQTSGGGTQRSERRGATYTYLTDGSLSHCERPTAVDDIDRVTMFAERARAERANIDCAGEGRGKGGRDQRGEVPGACEGNCQSQVYSCESSRWLATHQAECERGDGECSGEERG